MGFSLFSWDIYVMESLRKNKNFYEIMLINEDSERRRRTGKFKQADNLTKKLFFVIPMQFNRYTKWIFQNIVYCT